MRAPTAEPAPDDARRTQQQCILRSNGQEARSCRATRRRARPRSHPRSTLRPHSQGSDGHAGRATAVGLTGRSLVGRWKTPGLAIPSRVGSCSIVQGRAEAEAVDHHESGRPGFGRAARVFQCVNARSSGHGCQGHVCRSRCHPCAIMIGASAMPPVQTEFDELSFGCKVLVVGESIAMAAPASRHPRRSRIERVS